MSNTAKGNLEVSINTKEKIDENVLSKKLTFYLQNQKTGRSQLFTLSLSFDQTSMNSQSNLYCVFGSQTGQGVQKFEIFDSGNCQFRTINYIQCDHLSRTYIVKDPQFWRIVRESLSLVTIKFQPIPNSHQKLFKNDLNSTNISSMPQLTAIHGQSQGVIQQQNIEKQEALLNGKDRRSGQRSIQQVILLVQRWRGVNTNHTSQGKKVKKIDLRQNARQIGVSKKTLDDYYYQLRCGQKLGFNFMKNFNKKIGVLRNFIKSKIPHRKTNGDTQKLGKTLNIICTYSSSSKLVSQNLSETIETEYLSSPQQTSIQVEPPFYLKEELHEDDFNKNSDDVFDCFIGFDHQSEMQNQESQNFINSLFD